MTDHVIDANISAMLVIPEELSDKAFALVDSTLQAGDRLIAPPILPVEVTNAVRKHMRRYRLTIAQAMALLDEFLRIPIELEMDADLHRAALRLTERFSLGAHDAHYVALAERLDCDLWTSDMRLLRAVGGRLPFMRFIGDYQPGQ